MQLWPCHLSEWDATASDEELVQRAQQGQVEAFGLLYDRHFGSVYGYCYRRLGMRESAQDAAAETFRKALSALPGYRPQAFRGWLFTIARNVLADAGRAHQPTLRLEAAAHVPWQGDHLRTRPSLRASWLRSSRSCRA